MFFHGYLKIYGNCTEKSSVSYKLKEKAIKVIKELQLKPGNKKMFGEGKQRQIRLIEN